jgi:hypothetical protein
MPLEIQAFLTRESFAVGEEMPLVLVATNPGPAAISIIDPRQGGRHLRFQIQLPTGNRRTVSMADALFAPGVPPIVPQVQAPVAYKWNFEFDLAKLAKIDQPGDYGLVVEYDWQPGETWRSSLIQFRVAVSAAGSLVVIPSEASGTGYHALVWLHTDGAETRALLIDFRFQRRVPHIEGAVEIARLKPDSAFTLSTSPAGMPFPDRWVVWVEGEQAYLSYWARTPVDRLPPQSFSVYGGKLELIRPVLASRAPDEGRPGCLIGLLSRSANSQRMVSVEINPKGQVQISEPLSLAGSVRAAWAAALGDLLRLFVFASQSGPNTDVLSISCPPGLKCQAPVSWFTTEAMFLAGDIRVAMDSSVHVGLLLERGGQEWERLTFVAPKPGEKAKPVFTRFKHPARATAVRVRLDSKGHLHALFQSDGELYYVAPQSAFAAGSFQRPVTAGNSADLLISPDGVVVLIYYDFEKGPTFLRV